MKAVYINIYGNNDVIQIGDLPTPSFDEQSAECRDKVLVEVYAASLNPIDFKMRSGMTKLLLPYSFPLILGHDFSGVVVRAGPESRFKVGDAVYGRVRDGHIGTLAQYVLAFDADIAAKPDNITHEEASSIPLVGLTVFQAFTKIGSFQSGQKVFIPAGGGGIGSFALQFAKNVMKASKVITTASESKAELCKSLGADVVINYRSEKFEDRMKSEEDKVDFVFDTTGEVGRQMNVIKTGGQLMSIANIPDGSVASDVSKHSGMPISFWVPTLLNTLSLYHRKMASWRGIRYQYVFMQANGAHLDEISSYIREGLVRPVVGKVFKFEEAKEAFAHLEQGHAMGKVVVRVKE